MVTFRTIDDILDWYKTGAKKERMNMREIYEDEMADYKQQEAEERYEREQSRKWARRASQHDPSYGWDDEQEGEDE